MLQIFCWKKTLFSPPSIKLYLQLSICRINVDIFFQADQNQNMQLVNKPLYREETLQGFCQKGTIHLHFMCHF